MVAETTHLNGSSPNNSERENIIYTVPTPTLETAKTARVMFRDRMNGDDGVEPGRVNTSGTWAAYREQVIDSQIGHMNGVGREYWEPIVDERIESLKEGGAGIVSLVIRGEDNMHPAVGILHDVVNELSALHDKMNGHVAAQQQAVEYSA